MQRNEPAASKVNPRRSVIDLARNQVRAPPISGADWDGAGGGPVDAVVVECVPLAATIQEPGLSVDRQSGTGTEVVATKDRV